MNPLDPAALVLAVVAAALLFAAAAYLTRATPRRIAGSLIGAVPLVPLVLLFDVSAARLGWWRYPSVTTGSAPLAWYVAGALSYGAALGLVGWRVIRRFGARGLAGFVIGFAILGVTRDYLHSVIDGLIVFGPGPVPLLADAFAYASGAVVVQGLMYWVAGPPRSDPLAHAKSRPMASR